MDIRNLLKKHQEIEQKIYDYFGYADKWAKFCIEDCTKYFWCSCYSNDNFLYFKVHYEKKDSNKTTIFKSIEQYKGKIIKNNIYKKNNLTLILLSIESNENIFFGIFDDSKEFKSILNINEIIENIL